MERRVGGLNYEGRNFIVKVSDEWRISDPLPPPGPEDLWFDRLADFTAELQGPWNRKPVNRHAWVDGVATAPPTAKPTVAKKSQR
jgi:hypothetical protein